ncbi:histidine phosphotranseferase [Fusarium circinatum]|uniref:Histidine phosphotranseferase n=1 Tax=Fusarium circinatum TaxID=48490 RepID=A0A8H5T7L7_FUSCI|nr:histidine phosphotranseferase [Fusarium circinatum]
MISSGQSSRYTNLASIITSSMEQIMEDTWHLVPSEPTERQHTPPNADKHRILLLGASGVGKSSFIARTARCEARIGHSMVSCTTHCASYDVSESGSTFTLIETPGFNDTTRDNTEILSTIIRYLDTGSGHSLAGMIYLHRITDTRVCGADFLNLQMLKALAGPHFYSRVVVASTMWDTIPNEELGQICQGREAALKSSEKYWQDMIAGGCGYFRFRGDEESGLQILRHFVSYQSLEPPAIIAQLNQKRSFEETDAGCILVKDRRRREQARLRELEEAREEEGMAWRLEQQIIAQNNAHGLATYTGEGRHRLNTDRSPCHRGYPRGPEHEDNAPFSEIIRWLLMSGCGHRYR